MKTKTIITSLVAFIFLLSFTVPQNAFALEKLFYYFDNSYGLDYFKKYSKDIDVIAPQIYTVDYDLKVSRPTNTKILREAKKKKTNVMPLLVNADFNKVLMSDILLNQDVQNNIIDYLIEEADDHGYIGWQFDFENINHLDRDMYTAFVAKTYARLQKEGLRFSVAVVTRERAYDPNSTNQDWSSAYDYANLAKHSDFLSLMTYDDPRSVGPTASYSFTLSRLNYIVTQVPANKISLGIPLYCWKWNDATGTRVGSRTHKLAEAEYKKGKNSSKGYDANLGAQWFKYTLDGTAYTTWCESKESIEFKMELAKNLGLRGISAWAIGQESTKWFWKIMKKY